MAPGGPVSSCPAFRRRFRDRHPAPLLGLFSDPHSIPTFGPCRGLDRDMLAAVRGGDFHLTSAQPRDVQSSWTIEDCRGGYLLLEDWETRSLALFNPMARASCPSLTILATPPDGMAANHRGLWINLGVHLLCSDEEPTRFKVVTVCLDESRVVAAAFSWDSKTWQTLPWLDITTQPHELGAWLCQGMQANGSLYWTSRDNRYTLRLNTRAMEFSIISLLPEMRSQADRFFVCETKEGALCTAYANEFSVVVLIKTMDSEGIVTEVRKTVQLEEEVYRVTGASRLEDIPGVNILEIRDGFIYLATSEFYLDAIQRCWFQSLCLETMELKMLVHMSYDGITYPYIL